MASTATTHSPRMVGEVQINDFANCRIGFSAFSPEKAVVYDGVTDRLYKKVESLIKSATAHSQKGCLSWRKSKMAARIIRRLDLGLPLTKWQSVTARVLAEDDAVEARLIEQALDLYPVSRV